VFSLLNVERSFPAIRNRVIEMYV